MQNDVSFPRLLSRWRGAADQLGFNLEAPYFVKLESGRSVQAIALIRLFGGRVGMLLIDDFSRVAGVDDELSRMGYGMSVTEEYSGKTVPDPTGLVSVLQDWDWFGPEEERPTWLD